MIPRASAVLLCFPDLEVYARLVSSVLSTDLYSQVLQSLDSIFGDLSHPVLYTEHQGAVS